MRKIIEVTSQEALEIIRNSFEAEKGKFINRNDYLWIGIDNAEGQA